MTSPVITGSVQTFNATNNTSTHSISIPADAELLAVGIEGYTTGTSGLFDVMKIGGSGGTAMNKVAGDTSSSAMMGALFWVDVRSLQDSSQDLYWNWLGSGALSYGGRFVYAFYKDCDWTDSPVRDSDGVQSTGVTKTTKSLSVSNGDLVVAWYEQFYGGTQATTWTNATEVQGYATLYNQTLGSWAEASPTGNTTIAASAGSSGDHDGAVMAFVLKGTGAPVVAPTVTTQDVSDVDRGAGTATGNGAISNTGGENCTKRGIVYGTTSQSDPGNTAPGSSSYDGYEEETGDFGTGAFTRSLTSLTADETYYARAYAYNSEGYSYGDEVSFSTEEIYYGLEFWRNADAGDNYDPMQAIVFVDPQDDGLPIYGPSNAGITVIREIKIKHQASDTGTYYAQFWWSQYDGDFTPPGDALWGFHPFPKSYTGDGAGHYFELQTTSNQDKTVTLASTKKTVEYDTWLLQAMRVTYNGDGTKTFRSYLALPSVADADIIELVEESGVGNTVADVNAVVIGDSPWYPVYNHETFCGILGRIKIIAKVLSESDMLAEAADMTQLVTTDGQNNIWWGKTEFTSVDDLTCDYGTDRSFVWADSGTKATLAEIPAPASLTTVEATTGSVTIASLGASISAGKTIACGLGQIAIGALSAVVSAGSTVNCSTGAISISGINADISAGKTIACSSGALSITGYQAQISTGTVIECSLGQILISGIQAGISLGTTIDCSIGSVVISGINANVSAGKTISCTSAALAIAAYQASVSAGSTINCTAGAVTVSGLAAVISAGKTIACGTGQVTIGAYQAEIDTSGATLIECGLGQVVVSGIGASISAGSTVNCNTKDIAVTGLAADVEDWIYVNCNTGAISISGLQADISEGHTVLCTAAGIVIIGLGANIIDSDVPVGAASVSFSVAKPGISFSASKPSLSFTAKKPNITITA